MATSYPASLDSFTNPSTGDPLNSPSHAGQHVDINDAMEAVQTKLGVGAGTIGEATSFTPTWSTGVTVGNGTITAYYVTINEYVHVSVDFTLGSRQRSQVMCGWFCPYKSPALGLVQRTWWGLPTTFRLLITGR